MKPFFSIIVPCCDVAQYLRECLDSVVKQPFSDWECLLGVEQSKDNTEEIAREYAAKDPRFKVFTGPRTGSCSASRNTGIDMATGEYIIFLDGDDTITDGSLQRLHDKIAARPGADLYPCAIQVHNDITGKDEELRDNYPADFNDELNGAEATLITYSTQGTPCPMLQLSVFRQRFLSDNNLKCVLGLRRQDSEFSPRALYLATRVIPLHEPFYIYRIQATSVSSSARGPGYFHGDWSVILKSLFAFHANVARANGFDKHIAAFWARHWIGLLLFLWFSPDNIKSIPRSRRSETLKTLFTDGFSDILALLPSASPIKRIAARLVLIFVRHPAARPAIELLFRIFLHSSNQRIIK